VSFALYSTWRDSNRLCALLCLSVLQLTNRSGFSNDTPTDVPLYRLPALLCLSILSALQLTIRLPTNYSLWSLWRYSNRLSTVHFSVWRYCNRGIGPLCLSTLVQPTIRSALSVDTTVQSTTRSILHVDIITDYPLYQLSTMLSLALLQSTIYCDLLGLSILQPTFLCALFHSVCQHHYSRLSALFRDSDGIISERDRATIRSALS
jgi:hypothetical protein